LKKKSGMNASIILQIIGLIIAVINAFLPMKIINKYIFRVKED